MSIVYEYPSLATPAGPPETAADMRPTAEIAECTCPEFCERDHDND
jgi:hypothetical protein